MEKNIDNRGAWGRKEGVSKGSEFAGSGRGKTSERVGGKWRANAVQMEKRTVVFHTDVGSLDDHPTSGKMDDPQPPHP